MIIGIEGPAGAGKSTMARTVATEMGVPVLEGGSWYRALTHVAQRGGVASDDVEALCGYARSLDLEPAVDEATGATHFLLDGRDATAELYSEEVSVAISSIARHMAVREIIEPKIAATARMYDKAIFVGRHLKRAMPEVKVLRLMISEDEAERRHAGRVRGTAQRVAQRNAADSEIATMLGNVDNADAEVDVTNMTQDEQADLLRKFIRTVQEA